MKHVLLVAFHFPPVVGSSGVQRALRFAQYLPEHGWLPTVLTASVNAYDRIDLETLGEIPRECRVIRAPCFDAARVLGIAGRYPGFLEIPDRWANWAFIGAGCGARACRRDRVDVLWSTYPIATAHVLAERIQRRTGLPWIADFRDPMAQDGYPTDPRRWRAFHAIEQRVAQRARRMVFVTPSAQATYRARFGDVDAQHFVLIENGYDEAAFDACAPLYTPRHEDDGRMVILHSGVVYPSERDPAPLIQALGRLYRLKLIRPEDFVLRFRASAHDAMIRSLAAENDVLDFLDLAPPIPYVQALAEMMQSDALLVMQASNCDEQIPAKVYEYFRAGRPILGLASSRGETGKLLRAVGVSHVAPLESADDIGRVFLEMLEALRTGAAIGVRREVAEQYSRRSGAKKLANLLDEVAPARPART